MPVWDLILPGLTLPFKAKVTDSLNSGKLRLKSGWNWNKHIFRKTDRICNDAAVTAGGSCNERATQRQARLGILSNRYQQDVQ